MTQNQLIELVRKQFPSESVIEIRAHLNDALIEFCSSTKILTGTDSFSTTTDLRYYDLDEFVSEVISVDFDGYDIPRLTGRPEKRDLT
tara:strand:+ start:37 stop:300 length:264 start_codon:yes stop_codon:yes gene_type:complete